MEIRYINDCVDEYTPVKKARGAKYLPLTKRKSKNKCGGRAGTKATIMGKTYMVKNPLAARNTSEPLNAKNAKISEKDNLPKTLKVDEAMILLKGQNFADANTFTNILSSAQTDTLKKKKDSSLESTRKKDP